eukprot:3254622-Amphidinium_carterae.2
MVKLSGVTGKQDPARVENGMHSHGQLDSLHARCGAAGKRVLGTQWHRLLERPFGVCNMTEL